jgi:hypothetical protein
MHSPKKITVRFLRDHGIYSAGEAPTFDEREATRLAAIGAADILGAADDEATLAKVANLPPPATGPSPIVMTGPSGGTHPEAKSTKPPKATRPSSTRVAAPQLTRDDDDADGEG